MAILMLEVPKREKELEQHTRLVHESDGSVVIFRIGLLWL